jgi:immunity protein 35 of polymorphic toxin system
MIRKDEARAIAMAEILKGWNIAGDEPVILDEYTVERDFGWVFFYDSRKHHETQLFEFVLAGNAPIIVNRFDSSLHTTGTAFPTEHYIHEYEEKIERLAGRWSLIVNDLQSLSVLKALRKILNLPVEEVGRIKESSSNVIRKGSKRDMESLCEALVAEGVEAEIEETSKSNGET